MRLDTFVNESANIDPYTVVETVYYKSLPFIMELNNAMRITLKSKVLFSGRKNNAPMFTSAIRKDRYPKDTNPNAHALVDRLFHQYHKVYARSQSIFVTGNAKDANSYGDALYGIFPNGNDYSIIWSDDIKDLYSDLLDSSEFAEIGEDIEDIAANMAESYNESAWTELEEEFREQHSPGDYDGDDEFEDDMRDYIDQYIDERSYRMALDGVREDYERSMYKLEKNIKDYNKGGLRNAILSGHEIMLSGKSYTAVRYDYLAYVLKYMEVNKNKRPTPELFASAIKGEDFKDYIKMSNSNDPKNIIRRINKNILSMIDISDLKKP